MSDQYSVISGVRPDDLAFYRLTRNAQPESEEVWVRFAHHNLRANAIARVVFTTYRGTLLFLCDAVTAGLSNRPPLFRRSGDANLSRGRNRQSGAREGNSQVQYGGGFAYREVTREGLVIY